MYCSYNDDFSEYDFSNIIFELLNCVRYVKIIKFKKIIYLVKQVRLKVRNYETNGVKCCARQKLRKQFAL